MKSFVLTDILTDEEIDRARAIYQESYASAEGIVKFPRVIETTIIKPNIERINKALGQENDTLYLAYAVEYVLSQQRAYQPMAKVKLKAE